ncbi:tyrosine-type recombinase/integrase [Kribbella sp. NPDC020789]
MERQEARQYEREEEHPPTLAPNLVAALLKITSGKSLEDRRDHAIIRVLLHGPRRTEAARIDVEDLDLTSGIRTLAVVGLKGRPSHRIDLGDRDVLALKRWLNVRSPHRRIRTADSGPLWIAERTGAALKGDGIYQMLRRRCSAAGYPPESIRPPLPAHHAHEALASGHTEAEVMAKAGWKDRDGRPLWRKHGRTPRLGSLLPLRLRQPLLTRSRRPRCPHRRRGHCCVCVAFPGSLSQQLGTATHKDGRAAPALSQTA